METGRSCMASGAAPSYSFIATVIEDIEKISIQEEVGSPNRTGRNMGAKTDVSKGPTKEKVDSFFSTLGAAVGQIHRAD